MVQFLSIIFWGGFLQFLLGFSKVPVFCVILYIFYNAGYTSWLVIRLRSFGRPTKTWRLNKTVQSISNVRVCLLAESKAACLSCHNQSPTVGWLMTPQHVNAFERPQKGRALCAPSARLARSAGALLTPSLRKWSRCWLQISGWIILTFISIVFPLHGHRLWYFELHCRVMLSFVSPLHWLTQSIIFWVIV